LYGRGHSRGLIVIDSVAGARPVDEVVITYQNTGTTQSTTVQAIQSTYEFEAESLATLDQVPS
jgi:predicted Abi (CAAX) family protease